MTADPGAPREQLARRVDALFTQPETEETRALVVMHNGRIAAERYAPGYGPDTRLIGWSMSKTITGVMIGMLVADGKLRLNESAPIPRWQRAGDPRGEITLKQLLQMRSGLRHTEAGEPIYESGEVRMLFLDGRDDMAAYAESQPLEAEPGAKFEYSSATTVILADIAARALTDSRDPEVRRQAVDDFLKARIFHPLGMNSMVAEYDRAGTLIGGSLIHGTARDWARFGELIRHYGSVGGAQLVPRAWIEFMERPSPRSPDYGGQLWLNRPSGTDRAMLFADQGPRTAVALVGHLGQYVVVSPRQRLTMVRMGKTEAERRPAVVAAMTRISALYPVK